MNPQLQKIQAWLESRAPRERIIILIIGLLFIYVLWNLMLFSDLTRDNSNMLNQIQTFSQQIQSLNQQKQTIITDASKPADPNLLAQNNLLKIQLNTLSQRLNDLMQQLTTPAQMLTAIKSVLAQAGDLSLTRLENVPVTTPPPTTTTAAQPQNPSNALYEHDIVLEFNGDYFTTLRYLQRLESLHWRFFWDDLTYTVTKYPLGQTSIKLHTLSAKENLLDV